MLIQDFLAKSAECFPDKDALICGNQRLSYQQVEEQSTRLASALLECGIQRQDRVAIFLDNSAESVISLFGILKAGGIFIMLSATMKTKKLNYILNDSGAKVLITHLNKSRIAKEAIQNASAVEHIIWCSNDEMPNFKCQIPNTGNQIHHVWSDVLQAPCTANLTPHAAPIDLDLATIIYTSGSTGDPKGIMSAHCNVISAATSIISYLENSENDIILSALPLSFDYGLYQVLMAFIFGGIVVLEKSFMYPMKVLQKLVEEKVTGFPIVPTMAALLLQMENLQQFDLSSLRYLSNTAASLPVAFIRKLLQVLPDHTRIFSMYGLTECKRVSYLPPEYIATKPESVGIPMPNTEVLILDEDGKEATPGQIGELVVRGANVMQGYWGDPEATARTFRPGRYPGERLLYSGDLFKRDEDGFLYFVGRRDDMIKTRGERVCPKEIESCLCEIKGITEVAVIGTPDDILGHAVKAFVVLNNGNDITPEKVMSHCQLNLESFMVPKYLEFVDQFEKTSSGKIDKKKLK